MKHILLAVLMSLAGLNAASQQATVIDQNTRQMLQEVIIRSANPPLWTYTDAKGRWDAGAFKEADTVWFTKPGYKTLSLPYANLKEMAWLVGLEPAPFALGEAVISVGRWEESKLSAPNRIETIGLKEVAFQNPQTAADMLALSGYAYVQKSQMGGGSPMLRGFATNRVLLVVDGVRMNTAIFRSGNLQNVISLDANAIERTEIMFGPGGVMYGSDAIGGVMSFSTLKPKLAMMDNGKPLFTGNAFTRTSTANSENTIHADINLGWKKWAFVTSFTGAKYGDLRSGSVGGDPYFYRPHYVQTIDNVDYMVPNEDSTLQVGSAYSQINFMQKVHFRPNKFWEADYGFHFSETSEFGRYDRLYIMRTSGPQAGKLRFAEWYYGPQKWNMHRLSVLHRENHGPFDRIRLTAALQHFEESRFDRQFMDPFRQMQRETVEAASVNLDMEKHVGEKLVLRYGGELVHNTVGSNANLTNINTDEVEGAVTRYPDGSTWATAGAYANAQYTFGKAWMITAGVRYSTYRIRADFDTTYFPFPFSKTEMSSGGTSGSLGAVWTPNESWQLYANAASGFRAPNVDDMGKVFESAPGYLVVPNPNLKPETVFNVEAGAVKILGEFAKIDAALYHTWLKDAMVRRPFTFNGLTQIEFMGNASSIEALQNIAEIRAYGLQTGVAFFFKGWGLRSTLSLQDGKEQSADSLIFYPLRHAPPTFGSTHLWYAHKMLRFEAYALYNARVDYEDLALSERVNQSYAKDENGRNYSAGWYTLNFKAAYYANEYVMLTAGVENIMDILYRPYSSGINAPGRNLIISLNAKF